MLRSCAVSRRCGPERAAVLREPGREVLGAVQQNERRFKSRLFQRRHSGAGDSPGLRHTLTAPFSQDFGVTCRSYSALTLFSLGYPDRALERSREAVKLARDLKQPFSLGFALYIGSFLHKYRREPEAMLVTPRRGSRSAKSRTWRYGWVERRRKRWALVELGHLEEGVSEIRRGLNAWLATGAEVAKPYYLALLTDAELRIGRCADGLRRLDECLAVIERLSDRFCEVELHRLKGELILHQHSGAKRCNKAEAEAEASCQRAPQVARDQSAKSWELRAAMSFVRLLQKQDRREEAEAVLAPTYEWFTEGLDTRDLSEERALLKILH